MNCSIIFPNFIQVNADLSYETIVAHSFLVYEDNLNQFPIDIFKDADGLAKVMEELESQKKKNPKGHASVFVLCGCANPPQGTKGTTHYVHEQNIWITEHPVTPESASSHQTGHGHAKAHHK